MSMMKDDTRSIKASAAVANSCPQGQRRFFWTPLIQRATYRKRASRYGGVHLNDEKKQVDGEGRIHGELDPWLVLDIFLDLVRLLILGAEELVDEPVLSGVVLLDALLVALGVLELDLLRRCVYSPVASKVQRICPPDGGRECA
jgi:hypothetical protein